MWGLIYPQALARIGLTRIYRSTSPFVCICSSVVQKYLKGFRKNHDYFITTPHFNMNIESKSQICVIKGHHFRLPGDKEKQLKIQNMDY
jgi:hypothetical protein